MNFFDVFILSVVEGVTEFLPISSTGHMILAAHAMGLEKTHNLILFEIVTQLGATLAIVVLFSKRLLAQKETLFCVGVGFIPTAFLGFFLYTHVTMLFTMPMVSIWTLIIGGFLLIGFDQYKSRQGPAEDKKLNWKRALIIGICQSFAFIPGTSRSMATILAGMGTGLSRRESAEFSFLLAIPTMFAASVWSIYKFEGTFDQELIFHLIVGSIIAFIVAYYSVKVFMLFIDRFGLTFFGIYRILFAGIFYILFIR